MTKKGGRIWWLIGIIAAAILAAVAYAATNSTNMPTYSQPGAHSAETDSAGPPPTDRSGAYIDYSAQNFANASGQRWLFFHAGWCPQCRALEQSIQASGVPQNVTIFKVDYDSTSDLKEQYGVTLQTTVVAVDANGNELKKFVAYNEPTLDAVVSALKE